MNKRQLTVFGIMLLTYALSTFVSIAFLYDQMSMGLPVPEMEVDVAPWVLGLANAGIVLVVYGLLGLAGYWFARKLGLPGVLSENGNRRGWVWLPMLYGGMCGIALVIADIFFAPINGFGRFPHPQFPLSILASLSAAIGEEILFRGFVFGLWALLLNLILKRWNQTKLAIWIANVISALAFGAGHLPAAMLILGLESPAQLPPILLMEIFLLNGFVGIVAGNRYIKDGLVAAAGVHFWTDIVWHVLWGFTN
jgi:membrane protease YdiL (CAAX protease family)